MFQQLCISLAIFSVVAISPYAQARTFKIATVAPEGTAWVDEIRQGAKLIEEKTQGRVKFKFYTGGIMGSDSSVIKKMRIGQLHGGAISGGGLQDIYPDSQIYALPFMFHDFDEVDHVRKTMDDLIRQGLQSNGIKALGLSEGGFAYFMSRVPVRTVNDLSSLKNWLPEGDLISQTMYEALGVTPVPLALTDVYTGLQTGLIDTVGANATGAIAFQWHTKVRYATDIPVAYLIGTFVMDEKAFQQISVADQKIVVDVMADVFKKLDTINRENNIKARAALEQQGIEFIKLSAQDEARWRELADKTVRAMSEKGLFTERMYKVLTSLLKEYRQKSNKLSNAN